MRIFSNTAMSADGKIAAARGEPFYVGSSEDRRRMSLLRASADAVLIGGRTFRDWPSPTCERSEHRPRAASLSSRHNRLVTTAVLTTRGLHTPRLKTESWTHADGSRKAHLLVFGPEHRRAELLPPELVPFATVCTTTTPSVPWAIEQLAARGFKNILVEGGGSMIFECVDHDLLTDMFVTICPSVIGGSTAPTPADGDGFDADSVKTLELVDVDRDQDELFLHYRCKREKNAIDKI